MSLHDDITTEAASLLFNSDEYADYVDYTSNGDTKHILALCDIGSTAGTHRNPKELNRSYGDAVFTIQASDIPKPHSGDYILYNDKKYSFVVIESYMNGIYDVRFVSNESAMKGRL
jgi:hypothetical protein